MKHRYLLDRPRGFPSWQTQEYLYNAHDTYVLSCNTSHFCQKGVLQANQRLKPKDQVQLTPEELRQRMPPRVLYPQNPRAPQNITRFSFKDNQFKKEGEVEQTVFHLSAERYFLGALAHHSATRQQKNIFSISCEASPVVESAAGAHCHSVMRSFEQRMVALSRHFRRQPAMTQRVPVLRHPLSVPCS